MTAPITSGSGSHNDQILQGLESQGYTTGTITDREIERLEALTGLSTANGFSLMDLYRIAGEEARIVGE